MNARPIPLHRQALPAVLLLTLFAPAVQAQSPPLLLAIRGQALTAEVANTDAARMQGLMHRRMLPENWGMLFVFPATATVSMWMMNTYLPLSVAFIDDNGVIANIEDMKPLTTNTHSSARPARYALEMNQGWFRKRGIKPGDKVEGLAKAPPPQ